MVSINKKMVVDTLNSTANNLKNGATKLNVYALKSTEKVISGAFVSAEKWQGVTNNAIKTSLKFTATQQDVFFDNLETAKSQVLKGFQKSKTVFSKN